MILEKLIIFIAIIISYFLQTSVDFFRLGDIKPDFILMLTVFFALNRGSLAGLWVGFIGGLLQDINLGGVSDPLKDVTVYYIGTHALPKTLVGYFTGRLSKEIHRDSILVIFFVNLMAGFIKGLLTFFEIAVFYTDINTQSLATIVLPEAVYTAILSIFWFRIIHWTFPQVQIGTGARKI